MRLLRCLTLSLLILAITLSPHLDAHSAELNTETYPRVDLILWHQEGEDTIRQLGIQKIFDDWAKTNSPGSTLTLVQKEFDDLVPDFAATSTNAAGPDLLWIAGDHLADFASQRKLQSLDGLVDMQQFLPVAADLARVGGKTFGLPLQVGNQLMLFYNKQFVSQPPRTFDEMVKVSQSLQKAHSDQPDFAPLMYNQWDAFWALPVAHAFGGSAFDTSGKNPALDSDAWVKTYQLLHDLKYQAKIEPENCDYECADTGFKNGKAAMTFNGDWALNGDNGYVKILGDNLGIAPWPSVGSDPTKDIPAPFLVGTFVTISAQTSGDKLKTAEAFARFWATDEATALSWTVPNRRLPALLAAFNSDAVSGDPILSQTSKVLLTGVALPVQPELDCVMNAVTKNLIALMNDSITASDTVQKAQKAATDCIASMKTLS